MYKQWYDIERVDESSGELSFVLFSIAVVGSTFHIHTPLITLWYDTRDTWHMKLQLPLVASDGDVMEETTTTTIHTVDYNWTFWQEGRKPSQWAW